MPATPNAVPQALAVAAVLLIAPAAAALDFKRVEVALPADRMSFPPGAGQEAIAGGCLACHSAEMILNQPPTARQGWDATIHKMINVYKAPVDEKDIPAILDYLVALKRAD
ncbi:cytochrome c [Methylocella sp.]|uniref:cytochrome c n=1 Tax=Methylocella sp. TaxID=1978226 RepID=UPI003783B0DA